MSDFENDRPMLTPGDWLFLALMALMAFLLWGLSAAPHASETGLALRLNSQVIAQGNTLVVTCSVPRDARNRLVQGGITDYTSSDRALEGEESAVTNRFEFKPGLCGDNEAYCALVRVPNVDRAAEVVKKPFKVTGLFCE